MSEAKCETGWGELAPFSLSLGGQTEARSGAAKGAKLGSDRQALPMRPRSRDAFSPGVFQKFVAPKKQGRREGRALAAPVARQQQEKLAAVTTGLAEHTRPSPRDGFHGLYALSLGTGCLAPIAKAIRHCRLGISTGMPGPRDFTVASGLFVGARDPRCNPTRPPHPAPDVRDDREAPLV